MEKEKKCAQKKLAHARIVPLPASIIQKIGVRLEGFL
jgi:hypothetical protein